MNYAGINKLNQSVEMLNRVRDSLPLNSVQQHEVNKVIELIEEAMSETEDAYTNESPF